MGFACSNRPGGEAEVSQQQEGRTIEEVQAEHTPRWMAFTGVIGTGIGECGGEPCIVVYLAEDSRGIRDSIPGEVEGYPVRFDVAGPFRAQEPNGDS